MIKSSENKTWLIDGKSSSESTPSVDGEELMTWTIKAHPFPMLSVDIAMGFGTLIPVGVILFSFLWEDPSGVNVYMREIGIFGVFLWLFLWLRGARQKTVYRYRVTDQGGEVEYWEDYPRHMGTVLKWLTGILLFVVICLTVVEPTFIWGLAGPVGIAIVSAKLIFTWESKKKYKWFMWNDYEDVIIDRKRSVVVFLDHPLVFEAFLEKDQVDKYVKLIRSYMPPHTKYVEDRWKN